MNWNYKSNESLNRTAQSNPIATIEQTPEENSGVYEKHALLNSARTTQLIICYTKTEQ